MKKNEKHAHYEETVCQTVTIAYVQNATTQTVDEKSDNNLKQANDAFGMFVARELSNVPQIQRRRRMFQIIRLFELRGT